MERHAPRGGGNRLESSLQRGEEAIVHVRIATVMSAGEGNLAAKQLGSEAARSLEVDKSVSRWDDKSETAVGRICQSDNKIKTLYNTS